jgi:hypothetical protein
MLAERLSKAWRERRGSRTIEPVMRFSDEGLILGAGTVVVPSNGSSRDILIDHREPRLRALIAAAHLCRPTLGALAHLRKAADRWCEGQDALAAMHLALSGLERLRQPEVDAHRLFLADGLVKSGIGADAIIDAIEAGGPAFERLQKYNQDQPRVQAGSGRTSGEWTAGGSGSADGSRREPQVNPRTITEVSQPEARFDACRHAKTDCLTAAVDANIGDRSAANDNANEIGFKKDAGKCNDAYLACDFLSMVIEDIPLLDRGGVIFPHRGVVIMQKGKADVYFPPVAPGVFPRIRRAIEI